MLYIIISNDSEKLFPVIFKYNWSMNYGNLQGVNSK